MSDSLGRIAYNRYAELDESGKSQPTWDDLSPHEQCRWYHVGLKVGLIVAKEIGEPQKNAKTHDG